MTPDEAIARPKNVADWELERFRLGELPDAEMKRIGDLVAADGTLRLRLDGLVRSSEDIVDELDEIDGDTVCIADVGRRGQKDSLVSPQFE